MEVLAEIAKYAFLPLITITFYVFMENYNLAAENREMKETLEDNDIDIYEA